MKKLYLKHLDVNIESGELISIIGPNGCGKTILLKMLCGKIKNDNIYIDGKNINLYNIEYKRNNIVCIFDDNVYNTKKAKDELMYYLKFLNISDEEIKSRLDNFNNYFNLVEFIDDSFINLSVEKRIYIKILSLLIIIPNVVCIDDLFTYLNKDMKIKIFNYIKDKNITLISVTSNMEELLLFDKILVMNKGNKVMFDDVGSILKKESLFNELGLNLPFIYYVNSMLIS